MSTDKFDPYHKWLGIPPQEQPPHHYRLLGINLFESDPDVIDAAANQRMGYIQSCAAGPHVAASQKLLNEVAAARVCLLNPQRRAEYDARLKQMLPPSPGRKDAGAENTAVTDQARAQRTAPPPRRREAETPGDRPPNVEAHPAEVAAATGELPQGKKNHKSRGMLLGISIAAAAVGGLAAVLALLNGKAAVDNNLPGVMIHATKAESQGTWQRIADSGAVGGEYLIDDGSGGRNRLVFRLAQLAPGYYDTQVAYVPGEDRATNALVIVAQAGAPQQIVVNQRERPGADGQFHSLGTFHFTGSTKEGVEISTAQADGRVCVSALRLVKK